MKKFENSKWIHKADLLWIVNGKERETILSNQPYPVCRKKKAELEKTNHYKGGILVVISVRADKKKELLKHRFFTKHDLYWIRKRDGYRFDNEECELAILDYIENGKEP